MKYVGLVSGGKDSIFNLVWCNAYGHTLTCIANLHPPEPTELDSFMFQTVGVEIVPYIAQALEVPLIQLKLTGKSIHTDMQYNQA